MGESIFDVPWSCSADVCPPCGANGEIMFLVWAFARDGVGGLNGPLDVCDCPTLEMAQHIVDLHNASLRSTP